MTPEKPKKADKRREAKADQLIPYRWEPGKSGNPAGRPKSARSRICEGYIQDMAAAWEAHGAEVIAVVIRDKPEVFLKIAADLLPKEAVLTVNHFENMTDEQLLRRLAQVSKLAEPLLARMADIPDDTGTAASRH